jgi:hypothetical protein
MGMTVVGKIFGQSAVPHEGSNASDRRLRLWSVRIQLSDAEIGALVRLGYLGSPDDVRAIGYAATAFISDALFGT